MTLTQLLDQLYTTMDVDVMTLLTQQFIMYRPGFYQQLLKEALPPGDYTYRDLHISIDKEGGISYRTVIPLDPEQIAELEQDPTVIQALKDYPSIQALKDYPSCPRILGEK